MIPGTLLKAENPDALSAELRTSQDPLMHYRRRVVGLSLVSATCMGVVAAIRPLNPPVRKFVIVPGVV